MDHSGFASRPFPRTKVGSAFRSLWPALCAGALALTASLNGSAVTPAPPPQDVDDNAYYRKHIIAVGSNGSALLPTITCQRDASGNRVRYSASAALMKGESAMEFPTEASSKEWRKPYYEYISAILQDIVKYHPKHVVVYIHGGMNFVTGAIEKGAQLADEYRGREKDEYRISICWSSNLFSTYGEHLSRNVEGLDDRVQGPLLLPFTLLGDVGGAVVHAPVTLARLLTNDMHAADQMLFHRIRRAYARESELEWKQDQHGPNVMSVSLGEDTRQSRVDAELMDVAAWLATLPAKAGTGPIIDGLGSGAWQMMLRRTRTMFERETSFTSKYFDSGRGGKFDVDIVNGRPVRPDGQELTRKQIDLIEKVIYTGRRGAIRLFFEEAEKVAGLGAEKASRSCYGDLTLIGHSMGAIVVNEILARFGRLKIDNIVFMAAACRTSDFLRLGVPYLERNKEARFYNLCLHPSAERVEAQPGKLMIADPIYFPLEIAPRGSLLVWIDSFLDHPESEGDRTFGRWENAILAADMFPEDINGQITMKAFGRDRQPGSAPDYSNGSEPAVLTSGGLVPRSYVNEPRQHGDFTRYKIPADPKNPNYRYTEPDYWKAESRH